MTLPDEPVDALSRRAALQRAGVVVGAAGLAWAAPSFTSLGGVAFAAGTVPAAFASLTGPCGTATSASNPNNAVRDGIYDNFTATFPGVGAGVNVTRTVTLDGQDVGVTVETRPTDATGTASGYDPIPASASGNGPYSEAEVMFTLAGGGTVTVILTFVATCA